MASNIGIKIANGEFYPLLEENSSIKKKLVLSTVHDNQLSVQIDLYRSLAGNMTDAQYIGSIVVENIKPKPKGEPSIELVISSNENGDIVADAIDLETGAEHYVLTVSLKSIDETSRDLEIPDFDVDANEESTSGLYQHAKTKLKEKPHRSFTWFFILIGLIIILGLVAGWLFFLGGMEKVEPIINNPVQSVLELFKKTTQPAWEPETAIRIEPVGELHEKPPESAGEPVLQTSEPASVQILAAQSDPPEPKVQTTQKNTSVFLNNIPDEIPREGVNYVIKWGDTLWDISEAFYRDPWQYRRIANQNNIRNPNNIISGRIIRIPPKN
jgi:LysM repeat protein